MRTFKLLVSYDGTNYFGWQAQSGQRSVQETIEDAIARVTGQSVRILASGRTDGGVHALGQVVSFRLETRLTPEVLRRALNAVLPGDIAVLDASETHDNFHPMHQAVGKRYRYLIHDGPVRDVFRRRYCWHFRQGRLDAQSMHRSATALIGAHDFSSFETSSSRSKNSVRTIFDLTVRRGRGDEQDWITIEVEADGFLYNMVRAIVGTLVEVGRGVRPETYPAEVLRAVDRRLAGPTAPPQGLFLVKVDYKDRE
ncbi:MAG: tRNA pseudouridine(38-40) synthase TruA [Thermoguttaceae bacterium]|jgi:tRNA pseudouridine38-40 synthase